MTEDLILIAEDDADIREMLDFVLHSAGYETVSVGDGQAAAHVLTTRHPTAVITDVRMPTIDGIDLCRLVRRTEGSGTAVLMFTANALGSEVTAGMNAGADRYLTKPISPRHLLAELREVLASKSAHEQPCGQ
ncbi:putative response regulator receiver domain protein [Actinoplanes missouriensis 431]|uniref:Putative response regulator receiver domain protein n=1 Tax=Actinoplanes missouriensis (strain ATCC 14538 / DSM 43046 / CBS 188.64 / JCM 3121 / NBRC 102363 / NCIMB 12654 / NRRL B-3342 / UNCC 431) TaxID=512565 RepID=I0H518_ACTM4|nr:response regulator transcription factor [Actinoplanes missouriensis]BAL88105.1 putative response regulator receiver domain protein [Actinoplanes missouriensis 431]